MNILVTGGAGFIGSALIRHIIESSEHSVLNIDKLTYAGSLDSLAEVEQSPRYEFEKADICDSESVRRLIVRFQPHVIMHLAAESHVDRSIASPLEFINTNIIGTFILLEEARKYWEDLDVIKKPHFRFHHISTDEVYGDLGKFDTPFTEETPYNPSSPYAATKAGSDHLVRAWSRTFKLPIVISNCSNNYGPYQFPEKLIPLVILNALKGKELPIYGNGKQIRDWLYVEDHAKALLRIAFSGKIGATYNIGGHNELQNIEVVKTICRTLDNLAPSKLNGIHKYEQLISFISDRAGHDKRYAIDATKIARELSWTPQETFETGIKKTVEWYLKNQDWCTDE